MKTAWMLIVLIVAITTGCVATKTSLETVVIRQPGTEDVKVELHYRIEGTH